LHEKLFIRSPRPVFGMTYAYMRCDVSSDDVAVKISGVK